MKFNVIFYESENGRCPVIEFMNSLDIEQRAKLVSLIELLRDYGNMLREPYSKALGDKLFELRCRSGNNITRVIYFFYTGNKVVLTNGFTKKTQKTPKNVIELAKQYMMDFKKRGL